MIGYGDNLGTGFPEMVEEWEKAWGSKPILRERYELQIVELSFAGKKLVGQSDNDGSKNAVEKLTENQKKIIEQMLREPSVSKAELASVVGIHGSNIDRNIQKLKHLGLVVRVGSAKGGHWEVIVKNQKS